MTKPDLRNQVVSSLRWIAVVKSVGQLVNWAITLVVIRLLVPADYGLMAMANVIIGFMVMFAEMGFGASLVQSPTLEPVRIRQVWGAAILTNAAVCGALVIAAPAIAAFYAEPRLVLVIQIISVQFLLMAGALVPNALLRRELEFKRLSLVELATGVLGNVATLGLAYTGHGVWSLVGGTLAAAASRAILLQVVAPVRLWPSFSFRGARRIVSFGANLTLTRILSYVVSQTDILIAGKMLGKEALGLYSVALHLATLPMQRVQSIVNDIAFSAFAKIQGDRKAVASNVRLAARLIAFLAFPALLGLALVAPEVVRIAMGPNWIEAILPLQIVASTIPLRMIGTIVSTATISVGRVDVAMITNVIGTVLAPPLFLFAASYGIVGMSFAWVALALVMLAVTLLRSLPILGVPLRAMAEDLVRPAAAAALMVIAVVLVRSYLAFAGDGLRLAVLVLTGILSYLAATMLINRAVAQEARRILFSKRKRS